MKKETFFEIGDILTITPDNAQEYAHIIGQPLADVLTKNATKSIVNLTWVVSSVDKAAKSITITETK